METNELKEGIVLVSDGKSRKQPMKLQLSSEKLVFYKEELVYASETDDKGLLLLKVRTVTLHRETGQGLGISIKGGSEHHLPVLISRLFPQQAAELSGQIFVGDAIIKINYLNVEHCTHDEVVTILKNAGAIVSLTLKHFRPASYFLSQSINAAEKFEDGMVKSTVSQMVEKQWLEVGMLSLLHAFISRHIPGTDKLRSNAFEVHSGDGQSSALLHFDDSVSLSDWLQAIAYSISHLTRCVIDAENRLLLPSDKICFVCCVHERISPSPHWQSWKPRWLALRGSDVYVFDTAPLHIRDWVRCERIYHVYESMFKVLKEAEIVDARQHCFLLQSGMGDSLYLSLASHEELMLMERAWYRTNHSSVSVLKIKTFGCTWQSRLSGFTLDFDSGFCLYDNANKVTMWRYKFSQLRGSSDDSKTRLKLHFHNDSTKQIDTREIETTSLQTLIFSIHSFLSAKLASVDPSFLQNY